MSDKLQHLKAAVKKADPKFLLMARKNCHAANVSSIVIRNSPYGGLSRVFLAWPGHKLYTNSLDAEMVVGIRNHRSDIFLSLITGNVSNTNYIETPNNGVCLNKWKSSSGVVNGSPKVENDGTAFIKERQSWRLKENKDYWLSTITLHNISCDGIAAWWVHEGPVRQTVTTLFTKTDNVNVDGLYNSFANEKEVIAHVNDFISLCS